jgi:hypothetical protein
MLKLFSGSIVVGQTTSNAILLNEFVPVSIITGSNITGSLVNILGSIDNIIYAPVYTKSSVEISLTSTSGSYKVFALDPESFNGINYLKLQQGSSASPVAQKTIDTLFTVSARNWR